MDFSLVHRGLAAYKYLVGLKSSIMMTPKSCNDAVCVKHRQQCINNNDFTRLLFCSLQLVLSFLAAEEKHIFLFFKKCFSAIYSRTKETIHLNTDVERLFSLILLPQLR